MVISWLSLLPALIMLLCMLITNHLNFSLFIGSVSAALIVSEGGINAAAIKLYERFFEQITDINKLYLYAFLICISILIALLNQSGSAIAFARNIIHRLKSKKNVELSSMALSSLLFIDDYLSNLTVGYVMRPMTDRFAIPRAKLAFLVHSLASPIVILAPISSWTAMITLQLDQAGISSKLDSAKIIGEPFLVYLQAIPFVFYSFMIIGSALFIVSRHISYGPMQTHEQIAHTTGNLLGGKQAPHEPIMSSNAHGSAIDLILPIFTLIMSVIVGILYFGGYHFFGGEQTFLGAIKNNNQTEFILFLSGIITIISAFALTLLHRTIQFKQSFSVIYAGIQAMIPSIIMIILASTLGVFLKDDLKTGTYLAQTVLSAVPFSLLPCMFFFAATIIALITGSAWGTIAILIPIETQMLLSFTTATLPCTIAEMPLLLPILGAIFSGAICGNQISPISDTTIMAATSSGSYPLDHARTQFPYALPAIISTAVAFIVAGALISWGNTIAIFAAISTNLIGCVIMLTFLNKANTPTSK
ncbi:MAG TPA: Na+/H+ antiporter NhaC family protein [Candidatus Babeliales bacterium]|nr:Na+/H+ antiporter NhaC family protein [Candidatus Babeliales bacterium]